MCKFQLEYLGGVTALPPGLFLGVGDTPRGFPRQIPFPYGHSFLG